LGAAHPTRGESRFKMEKRRSTVVIFKRGEAYFADAHGAFGGGYSGCFAGGTAEEAALFAIREAGRYIDTNPLGGDLFAPAEVREAMSAAKVA